MKRARALLKKLTVGDKKQSKNAKISARGQNVNAWLKKTFAIVCAFFKQNWIGTVVILLAAIVFFWPMIVRIDSWSEGGDAMFNAWTLSRNHNCILGDNCPNYVDANIYFPNKDTMLYSETQLSAGVLTLPLHFINSNPIFAYNVWTIVSVFLCGFFMYLLAKYLSRGSELVSTAAGLIFAFAPFRMAAIFHLQNWSIFYLPLAFLLIFKYFDTRKKGYLVGLFATLTLQFYASWYNMVFVGVAIGILLLGFLIFKIAKLKQVMAVAAAMLAAIIAILPLALQYMRFSEETGAAFSLKDQTLYSSSLLDYFLPNSGTLWGKIASWLHIGPGLNAYNLDSISYHGITLYVLAAALVVFVFLKRKKGAEAMRRFGLVITMTSIGLVGLVLSLGPLLKIKGNYAYGSAADGIQLALPLPYLLIDKFLPQLTFIRAVGRWSVLFLFVLCCLLAYAAYYVHEKQWFKKREKLISIAVCALLAFELMPLYQVPVHAENSFNFNLTIPEVYKYVKEHKEINNIIVLRGDEDYPGAPIPVVRAEDVLWSGYHNRNIFNGYSGYTPPNYFIEYAEYKDFEPDDIAKMKAIGLQYVIVDKQLSNNRPHLADNLKKNLKVLYEDQRYALLKL
ncbi:MAG: hypothetical protein PVI21_02550 [Candidatus Woesebacteria bacterium]|jgi:hypothetical protein